MSLFDKLKSGIKNVSDRVTGDYAEVEFKLASPSVKAGEDLEATIVIKAKSDFKYSRIVLTLTGEEKVKFEARRGDELEELLKRETTTETFTLEQEVEGETELSEGDTHEVKALLPIPPDAKPSFESKHFYHRYKLHMRIDIPWGVDITETQKVEVLSVPPAERKPVKFERSDGCFYFRLNLGSLDSFPGERLGYDLEIGCMEEATIVATRFSLKAAHAIDCEMQEKTEDGEVKVTDNERVFLPKHFSKDWIYDEGKKIEAGKMVRSLAGLRLPQDLPTTYYGELCNSVTVLKCEVEAEGRKPLNASMNLTIHRPAEG